MNILVVAAHPDDEVLGCGGTIIENVKVGNKVFVLILGEGATSRHKEDDKCQSEIDKLKAQAQQSAHIMGVSDVFFCSLPDNRFDGVSLLDIIKIIEKHIRIVSPEIIYTQHGGDLNIDHQLTFQSVLTAARPMEGTNVNAIYAYETSSSTEWSFQHTFPVFRPNHFVDISNSLNKKLNAFQVYTEEIRDFPHPRSLEAIQAQAMKNGSIIGFKAAEAFETVFERIRYAG